MTDNDNNLRPFQFNEMLHALRETELYKLPKGKVLLSAGCAGGWYFDWIEKTCKPRKHIGVELYSPKPDFLPRKRRMDCFVDRFVSAGSDRFH